jgi:hypothetical protein
MNARPGDLEVVRKDALQRERRKATYAYVASVIAQIIAVTWGFLAGYNWTMIVERWTK